MKILFIYPSIKLSPTFSSGVGTLIAILKKTNHDVNLLILENTKFAKKLKQTIDDINPELILISCFSNSWEQVKLLASIIKTHYNLPIFVGGPHPTFNPESLVETEHIDAFCIGEGEGPVLEITDKVSKKEDFSSISNLWVRKSNGEIIKNTIAPLVGDLDQVPIPDRSLFPKQVLLNYPNFLFSRGCPFSCSYCCNKYLRNLYRDKGNYIRMRSVDNALAEIKAVVREYGFKRLLFDDDSFNKNPKWFKEFSVRYKKEVGLPFICNTRSELLSGSVASMLKEAGCEQINIGVENGDEKLRKEVLKRPMSDQDICRAFSIAKKNKLRTFSFNMIGIPGETKESFRKTIDINRKLLPDQVQLTIYYPYNNTELGNLCDEKGLLINGKSHYDYLSDSILNLPDFSKKEILKSKFYFEYNVFKGINNKRAVLGLVKNFVYKRPKLLGFLRRNRSILKKMGVS